MLRSLSSQGRRGIRNLPIVSVAHRINFKNLYRLILLVTIHVILQKSAFCDVTGKCTVLSCVGDQSRNFVIVHRACTISAHIEANKGVSSLNSIDGA